MKHHRRKIPTTDGFEGFEAEAETAELDLTAEELVDVEARTASNNPTVFPIVRRLTNHGRTNEVCLNQSDRLTG
jgi:hypothetical protein